MTFAIAPMIVGYFSQDESSGGAPGLLSIWKNSGLVRINDRDAAAALVPVAGIRGNVAPLSAADLSIVEAAGRRREGHVHVFTIERLQLDDEATSTPSWFILHDGYYWFLEQEDDWDYARGNRYLATRDRRVSGV